MRKIRMLGIPIKRLLLLINILNIIHIEGDSKFIKEIYSMAEAQNILDAADKHTLILYDVDETLIMPIDKILLPKFFSVNPGKMLKETFNQKMADCRETVWSNMLLQAHRKLIEPMVVNTIKALQAREVKVLGLTKMRTGRFGEIPSLAEYRFNQLERLGINFEQSHNQIIKFEQFYGEYEGFPLVYRGIIMTNNVAKGAVLGAFIDALDEIPRQVIFFDDSLENIISVHDEMNKRNIKYIGYHYRAVETTEGELDETVVCFQLDYLCKHEIWLSEQAACAMMTLSLDEDKHD